MTRPRLTWGLGALATALMLMAAPAFADDAPPKLDSGDTAWMLASTALVLLMTIPGLALFYAGMVRKKNILATMMQSFTICCIVTIVWMVAGYSIAFTTGNAFMGDFSRIMLHGIEGHIVKGNDTQAFVLASGIKDVADMATTIPETVYMMFQMTFAIITPALIAGAFADRMKFSAMCVFMTLWSLLIYSPIAHMGLVALRLGAISWVCWTSPAAPSCISTPASPGWFARSCWASGTATAPPTWRRTIWPTR
jgi:Amt family ammonium transporter